MRILVFASAQSPKLNLQIQCSFNVYSMLFYITSKSWALMSNFTFTFHFPALEKEMATHSSVLAWRIPGTEEPSGLPSMGSHRVGHN